MLVDRPKFIVIKPSFNLQFHGILKKNETAENEKKKKKKKTPKF